MRSAAAPGGRARSRRAGRAASDHDQRDRRDEAHDAVGAENDAVRAESAVAGERAARDVRRVIDGDADEQGEEQRYVVVEQSARNGDHGPGARDDRAQSKNAADGRGALHQWCGADALRPSMRDGTPHLLFERLEEARREREHDDPKSEDRAIAVGCQLAVRERQERV